MAAETLSEFELIGLHRPFVCLFVWIADLVKAYKKLAKERKSLLNVVKQTSPFEDLSDSEALLAHYSNLNNSIKVWKRE